MTADLEQRQLVPLASEDDRDGEVAADLPIDATLAGRAYQAITIQTSLAGAPYQLWIPLVDGTERLYYDADPVVPCTEKLEPGDRVLFYTDGVTEGRAADGTPFGLRRLSDFIIRHSAGLPAPETMRRLNRAIVDYQHGRLQDDATAVLVEWQPRQAGHDLTP